MTHFKLQCIRLHLFGYVFSPSFFPTICLLILLPIFLQLGVWQLHRAAEKRALEHDFAQQLGAINILNIKNPQEKNLRYRQVQAIGYFDNQHIIYLDNKMYHHKIGYHVLTPFIIPQKNSILLVNRGFVAIKNRQDLPNVQTKTGLRMLSGLIYFPSKIMLLKPDQLGKWPLRVQSIEMSSLEKKLHHPLYPFYLLLQKGDDANFIRDWHPVNFPSYRHTGYAIQWFSIAFTLVVIYLLLNTKKSTK